MSAIGVGNEVLSYCSKCKLTLAHIIVIMKNDNDIGKVCCNTCKSTHAYKDPSKVKARSKKAQSKKILSTDSISDIWMNAISNTSTKSKHYSLEEQFLQGDIIDHPTFGPGFIDKLIGSDKIQVIFRHNIRTLIHNKR